MSGKYQEISRQTRENFIDAFWQLYEKKDINKIKVQEICNIAGYHRNTFYHYFTDVYDILNRIEDRIIDELINETDDRLILSMSYDSAKIFAKILENNRKYLELFADDERGSKFPLKMNRLLKPIYRNLFCFSDNNAESECIQEYHLSGSIALIMQYFRGETNLSLERILDISIEICKQGNWQLNRSSSSGKQNDLHIESGISVR